MPHEYNARISPMEKGRLEDSGLVERAAVVGLAAGGGGSQQAVT